MQIRKISQLVCSYLVCKKLIPGYIGKILMLMALISAISVAYGDDYDWDGTSGNNWDTAHWVPRGGGTKVDTPFTTAGHDAYVASGNTIMTSAEFMSTLHLMPGGTLWLPNAKNGTNNIVWSGGTIRKDGSGDTPVNGTIMVATDSYYVNSGGGGSTINAVISGSADIILTNIIDTGIMKITADNSNYSGNWVVKSGRLQFNATKAVGSGKVVLENSGVLALDANVTLDNLIEAGSGSIVKLFNGRNVTLNNLKLDGSQIEYIASGSGTINGNINVVSPSILHAPGTGDWKLDAKITGIKPLVKTGSAIVYTSGDNSGFSGGWRIEAGQLAFNNNDALGISKVHVKNGGTLWLNEKRDWVLTNDVDCAGLIRVGLSGSSNSRNNKLTFRGVKVRPGFDNGCGKLTIDNGYVGSKVDAAFDNPDSKNCTLAIDVVGTDEVVGVDYSQLFVTKGLLSDLAKADLVVNVAPSLKSEADELADQELVIVSSPNGGVQSGTFNSVTVNDGWKAQVIYESTAIKIKLSYTAPGTVLMIM